MIPATIQKTREYGSYIEYSYPPACGVTSSVIEINKRHISGMGKTYFHCFCVSESDCWMFAST